jgi:hypothetical protein
MKLIAVMAAAATIAALGSAPSLAADTDATIEFSGGAVAAGIGYRWANGTLTYQGHTYPIHLSAISVGDVGAEAIKGTAVIHNLARLEDFEGTYGGAGVGMTLGVGGDAQALQNENGVTMYLLAKSTGLDINVSLDGIDARVEQ